MDSFKDHRGSVCLVNVINPSNKSVVVAQAPNVILWLRVKVTVRVTVWHRHGVVLPKSLPCARGFEEGCMYILGGAIRILAQISSP